MGHLVSDHRSPIFDPQQRPEGAPIHHHAAREGDEAQHRLRVLPRHGDDGELVEGISAEDFLVVAQRIGDGKDELA